MSPVFAGYVVTDYAADLGDGERPPAALLDARVVRAHWLPFESDKSAEAWLRARFEAAPRGGPRTSRTVVYWVGDEPADGRTPLRELVEGASMVAAVNEPADLVTTARATRLSAFIVAALSLLALAFLVGNSMVARMWFIVNVAQPFAPSEARPTTFVADTFESAEVIAEVEASIIATPPTRRPKTETKADASVESKAEAPDVAVVSSPADDATEPGDPNFELMRPDTVAPGESMVEPKKNGATEDTKAPPSPPQEEKRSDLTPKIDKYKCKWLKNRKAKARGEARERINEDIRANEKACEEAGVEFE